MNSLVWFRRDLRTRDNPALYHAVKRGDGVIAVYFVTPEQWKKHDDAPSKVAFWLESLRCLSEDLATLEIPLLIRECDAFADIPRLLGEIAHQHKCSHLFLNQEYEVWEMRRDQAVTVACAETGIEVLTYHDRVIVPPREIATKDGRFYSVFTPYRRVWDTVALDYSDTLRRPRKQSGLSITSDPVPDTIKGFDLSAWRSDLWKAGESEAQKRLKKFAARVSDYHSSRDLPSVTGTSLLSPYLTAGVVSPRQCLNVAMAANGGKISSKKGPTTWISELTWRDFYTHVLAGFPRVSMHQPFKRKTEAIEWRESTDDFEAWCEGQTGYPLVDAGMRQLNRTGWMHNRLRMVTAMFLSKHLLIDWRWGERYFMRNLIDGDLAANNGGWQWSASTGTDAVPYFRIFNPFSQSARFDRDGKFIKKMCPELEPIPASALHDPAKLRREITDRGVEYPGSIVDHKAARDRALAAFKSLSD